jgi:predicted RNase H-like nuclease
MTDQQLASEPAGRVVGLDGCAGGWVAVWADPDEQGFKSELYENIASVCNSHTAAERLLVDIPIGLATSSARECDRIARRRLGARGTSVFPAPCRAVVDYRQREGGAATYTRANEIQQENLGSGISQQAWNITPKIAAVNAFLRDESPEVDVYESHPEYCFAALNDGYPVAQPKSEKRGRAARFGVLAEWAESWQSCYEDALEEHYRKDVARDDIVDALVLCVAGQQSLASVPTEPPEDERGLPMQIVAPAIEPAWQAYTGLAER